MNKKEYQKPTMNVVQLQHRTMILAGSVTGVQSAGSGSDWTEDDDFIIGGGSNGSGR